MSDLVSLLLEAIKQVEQIARECGDADDRRWKWDLHAETVRTESGDYVACGPWDCDVPGNYALHMVTNDPNVILRRCQADRKIVEDCAFWLNENDAGTDPCAASVLDHLAVAYGLSVEEETTHE